MLNNFVSNLIIENVKKKMAGQPANSPINVTGMRFEPKHLSWSTPLLGGLKRDEAAHLNGHDDK
jgi:hypothetical protein